MWKGAGRWEGCGWEVAFHSYSYIAISIFSPRKPNSKKKNLRSFLGFSKNTISVGVIAGNEAGRHRGPSDDICVAMRWKEVRKTVYENTLTSYSILVLMW